jgi:hypothetical protein
MALRIRSRLAEIGSSSGYAIFGTLAARAARAAADAAIFRASAASAAATSLPRSRWSRRPIAFATQAVLVAAQDGVDREFGCGFGGFMGAGESPWRAKKRGRECTC